MSRKYVKSSIEYLYPGMVVPHDIYNSDATLLLVPQGSILNHDQIERLKRYNDGAGIINVSTETQRLLLKHQDSLLGKPLARELEDKTGYTEIKQDTFVILERMSHGDNISQTELYSISEELSHTVEVTAPSIILNLVSALASADEYLQRHCINVGMLCGLYGKWLSMPAETVDTLILVGLLHDCGKASIPNKILSAPRPLTIVEFEVIKTHPILSACLLSDFPEMVQRAARGHHEKIDGTGYPDGLSGNDIPLMARIAAVCDIYDAMVSRRSYKNPNSPFKILAELQKMRNTALDLQFTDVFIRNMTEELVGKKVVLTSGAIGTVSSISLADLEYPVVELAGNTIKTNERQSCVSVHFDSDDVKLGELLKPQSP